jgi:hypothetical protein
MRINNSKHVPWIIFVCLATVLNEEWSPARRYETRHTH